MMALPQNLHLREGEILGLLGKSGSGKSALLRVIAQREAHPALLLRDEPAWSELDSLAQLQRRTGQTLVIATREASIVQRMCRHVAVMEEGRIVEQFALKDVGARGKTPLAQELAEIQRAFFAARELAYG